MFELSSFTFAITEIVKVVLWKKVFKADSEMIMYLCWLTAIVIGACFHVYQKGYSPEVVLEGATVGLTIGGAYTAFNKKFPNKKPLMDTKKK